MSDTATETAGGGFAELFEESMKSLKEGEVVRGTVLSVDDEHIQIEPGRRREEIAGLYCSELAGVQELQLPPAPENHLHAWHLFPIRLLTGELSITRNQFVQEFGKRGVGFSVHWRPLHLHPYYKENGWNTEHLPVASRVWKKLVTLPLFSSMTDEEIAFVIETVKEICREFRV